jgi:hypothetical protein
MMLSKPLFPESMVPPMRKRRRSIGARIKPSGVGRVGLRADGAGDGCRARMRPRTWAMTSANGLSGAEGHAGRAIPRRLCRRTGTREPASLISGHAWIVRSTQTRPKS